MKTRSGFVSNSSSSSFVIAFSKVPEHAYDVLQEMFPLHGDGTSHGVQDPYGENHVDSLSAASLVWDQIKTQKPMSKKQILTEINSGYFDGYPEHQWYGPDYDIAKEYQEKTGKNIHADDADAVWKKRHADARKKVWADHRKAVDAAAEEVLEKEYPKLKGKKCFTVSFSDNDGGVFCTLEHGDTFDALPHIRISHH